MIQEHGHEIFKNVLQSMGLKNVVFAKNKFAKRKKQQIQRKCFIHAKYKN